jgi:hypothetical protein
MLRAALLQEQGLLKSMLCPPGHECHTAGNTLAGAEIALVPSCRLGHVAGNTFVGAALALETFV